MIPGFYVAGHPWLHPVGVYKVGFTRDLRRRLHDSGYILCFSPEDWAYVATFETETGDEAERLEGLVKEYYREARPWGNELVQATAKNIISITSEIVEALSIRATHKTAPKYPRPPSRGGLVGAQSRESDETVRTQLASIAPFLQSDVR